MILVISFEILQERQEGEAGEYFSVCPTSSGDNKLHRGGFERTQTLERGAGIRGVTWALSGADCATFRLSLSRTGAGNLGWASVLVRKEQDGWEKSPMATFEARAGQAGSRLAFNNGVTSTGSVHGCWLWQATCGHLAVLLDFRLLRQGAATNNVELCPPRMSSNDNTATTHTTPDSPQEWDLTRRAALSIFGGIMGPFSSGVSGW